MSFLRHLEKSTVVTSDIDSVFDFIDDHVKFSSHMNQSSWMMGGGKMTTKTDGGRGKKVGSHIKMSGKVLWFDLSLDEVVTERTRPTRKVWQTVGTPNLVVIAKYQMGIELVPHNNKTVLRVFINYDLPEGRSQIIGILFGNMYANWCVDQMLNGVVEYFK